VLSRGYLDLQDTAIKVLALRFFLGVQDYDEEKYDEDRAEAVQTQHELKRMSATAGASKRRHKRERDMKRVAKQIKRKESGEAAHSSVNQALTFPAIHLVYDPQKFAERLFSQLQQSGEVGVPCTALLLMAVFWMITRARVPAGFSYSPSILEC